MFKIKWEPRYKTKEARVMGKNVFYPHRKIAMGCLVLPNNYAISHTVKIDLSADIILGEGADLCHRSAIHTHEHSLTGREPILTTQAENGIKLYPKTIGPDVCICMDAVILPQADNIPQGAIIGASAVLTKNPGPYEIWAGNPARKVGVRE